MGGGGERKVHVVDISGTSNLDNHQTLNISENCYPCKISVPLNELFYTFDKS